MLVGLGDIHVIVEINRCLSGGIDDVGYCLVLYHEAVMFAVVRLQEYRFAIGSVTRDVPHNLT